MGVFFSHGCKPVVECARLQDAGNEGWDGILKVSLDFGHIGIRCGLGFEVYLPIISLIQS
jgi:hypothetical protein